MICEKCGEKMRVSDTRSFGNVCLRRYKCQKCGNLTKTVENMAEETTWNTAYNGLWWRKDVRKVPKTHDEEREMELSMTTVEQKVPIFGTEKVLGSQLENGDLVYIDGKIAMIIGYFEDTEEHKYMLLNEKTGGFGVISDKNYAQKVRGKLYFRGLR